MNDQIAPQQTRWGKNDNLPAGISIFEDDGAKKVSFIPWAELKEELEAKLLPQTSMFVKRGSTVTTAPLRGEADWVVQIIGPEGEDAGCVWFGSDPLKKWAYDGLVRIGPSKKHNPPVVWQTYQRYSNGSYRRLKI